MIKTVHYSEIDFFKLRSNINDALMEVIDYVQKIVEDVKNRGDRAVIEYSLKFDQVDIRKAGIKVSEEEVQNAYKKADPRIIETLREASVNIKKYHERQINLSWLDCENGSIWGRLVRPLQRVGIYVPGGTASYPSSVLMNGIPAIVAGVEEIVMISPPNRNGELSPYTLIAAWELGIKEIYKIGGAHGIAALAYGTETIKPVLKITGPGNIYVTAAKKLVFGKVDIDMLAGPSEIFIIADSSANPKFIAADMLSQAEHDEHSSAILATPDGRLAEEVKLEICQQLKGLPREKIAMKSIENNGLIVITDDILEAVQAANDFAPEHLEIMVGEPLHLLGQIKTAGTVFIGPYTPEPVGDYWGGTNHILPTGGTARFASPLGVEDFVKYIGVLGYEKEKLYKDGEKIASFAKAEGLDAHARAVLIRLRDGDGNEKGWQN
ncbi:MAG: Histidinol dehydrogenase [Clostridia bacterium 41_269]|nr:MAG: Histidinol dehydrogenase [Clostridia bacterium 41_269]